MGDYVPRTFSVPSSAGRPGPTFLLLHGIGLSHREFTGLARHLSRRGRVIAFDLPGFGELARARTRPRHRMSVEEYAAIVRRALERLDVGPVVVVGHSMGAQFAVELARQSPESVSHVVLVGPVVDARKPTLTAQSVVLLRDSLLEPPATQLMVAINYVRCGIPWFLTEAVAMRDYATDRGVALVSHPVLVIRGGNDPIADARWCRSLSELAPDGRVATIPGYRHNVVHSNPSATAKAILAFVDDASRSA
ncbi:alpha/beta fold hydrolase [Conyzicola nivalis]|uniref:Alpha/beta hydrolase n=2 Tax=Conyzicola nivalis TaxID=1477021 RepID=A0A916SR91_9MICO|nr:alpha/beta hydrolase [Conyzicola nivalis]